MFALVPSSAASAATPKCTIRELWGSSNSGVGFIWTPQDAGGKTVSCSMKRGDVNQGVFALQDSILHCYGINISVDGEFGTNTYNALRTVQGRIGVSVDGSYGPQTASKIEMRPDYTPHTCGHM